MWNSHSLRKNINSIKNEFLLRSVKGNYLFSTLIYLINFILLYIFLYIIFKKYKFQESFVSLKLQKCFYLTITWKEVFIWNRIILTSDSSNLFSLLVRINEFGHLDIHFIIWEVKLQIFSIEKIHIIHLKFDK